MSLHIMTESSSRRQRIAMACQYCRHRKIKCCGSTPCANCTRARRTCDYSPVPEEVNRATREKKAAAKAAKQAFGVHRSTPYYVDQSIYSMPYMAGPGPIRGTHVPPRRSYSNPGMTLSPYSPMPPAPSMASPAQFEAPWFTGLPVPMISVSPMPPSASAMSMHAHGEMVHHHMMAEQHGGDEASHASYASGTAPVSPTESSTSTSYPMPVTPVRKPIMHTPPYTPATAYFQTPNLLTYTPQQSFPFSPSPLAQPTYSSTSPTLCPGLPVHHPGQQKQQQAQQHHQMQQQPQQPLVGLGIGIAGNDDSGMYAPSNEYLTAPNAWVQPEQHYF